MRPDKAGERRWLKLSLKISFLGTVDRKRGGDSRVRLASVCMDMVQRVNLSDGSCRCSGLARTICQGISICRQPGELVILLDWIATQRLRYMYVSRTCLVHAAEGSSARGSCSTTYPDTWMHCAAKTHSTFSKLTIPCTTIPYKAIGLASVSVRQHSINPDTTLIRIPWYYEKMKSEVHAAAYAPTTPP